MRSSVYWDGAEVMTPADWMASISVSPPHCFQSGQNSHCGRWEAGSAFSVQTVKATIVDRVFVFQKPTCVKQRKLVSGEVFKSNLLTKHNVDMVTLLCYIDWLQSFGKAVVMAENEQKQSLTLLLKMKM